LEANAKDVCRVVEGLSSELKHAMLSAMTPFSVHVVDRHSLARTGTLHTAHGDIQTPNFMPVATRGMFHGMELNDARECGAQVLMCNTHHLNRTHGVQAIADAGGLHNFIQWHHPLATDSGGFQVFSLGWGMVHGVGKVAGGINARPTTQTTLALAQATIDDQGVIFSDGRELVRLTPEIAVQWQEKIGADIIFAFDECTSPLHDETYNRLALRRTHAWAAQSLQARTRKDQLMFGIVQGGTFASLRQESAKVIGAMPFEGIGIGGSFGQHAMLKV
jgi:queuine tRNA-ribosyltransferase/7-cyano-7-deazaguanine tRNA-ribosyltransferase